MTTCYAALSLLSVRFPVFLYESFYLCPSVLQQYVVSIDGNDPFIRWQMERGLDWTISSVVGESYTVDVSRSLWLLLWLLSTFQGLLYFWIICRLSDFASYQIDLTELLESWAAKNIHTVTDELIRVKPVWIDASFILKYHSDALFDFPHWFGFSKRTFKVSVSYSCYCKLIAILTFSVFVSVALI